MSDHLPKLDGSPLSAAAAGELIDHAAMGTAAGLPLDEIFRALAEDTDNRALRAVADRIADELRRGADMRTALQAAGGELPPYLRRTLEASADLGQTAAVLAELARHESTRRRLRRQMVSVMLYPAVVLGLLTAIVLGLTMWVVPQFTGIYTDMEMKLPDLTEFLLKTALIVPWVLGFVAAIAMVLGIVSVLPGGLRLVHWLRTSAPLLGRLWIWNAQHEFASILAALTAQRVPLDEAMRCTAASLRDRNLARSVRIAAEKCAEGAPLSRSLSESIHFDPALPALVGWGEASGALPEALRQAATNYEEELDLQAAFLQRVMPSLLFIGVITTIFFFVMGLMIPLVDMINNLSSWTPMAPPPSTPLTIERLVVSSMSLFTLGVCLRIALRLLYGARGPTPDDSINLLMRILGWGLLVLPMLVLSIVGANWLSLLLFVAIIEALGELVLARRASQRQAVWSLIGSAVGHGRSLVDALRFHQGRFSGIVGRWQRRLVRDLENGVDWQTAVWKNRRAVPREAPAFAAMVGSGGKAGRMAHDLDAPQDTAYRDLQRESSQRILYLGTVALAIVVVLAYLTTAIIPQYQAVYSDFDLTLPSITVALISFSHAIVRVLGAPMLVVALVAAVVGLLIGVLYLCDVPVLQRLTDRFTLFRHRAQVMRLLATALDHGKPVDAALDQLTSGAAAYPSSVVRRRLAKARRRVVAGDEWQGALDGASLISANDAAILRTAQPAGNLPWALRFLADRKVRNATFRWALLQQVAFVGVMLMLGLVVFLFCVAMLVPLADMVVNLSE